MWEYFFGEIEYQLDYSLSVNDQFTNLYKFFRKIESRIKKLYDDYLFLKLYKYAVVNDCEIYNNNVTILKDTYSWAHYLTDINKCPKICFHI